MNKNAIQKYAVWARNELIQQVKQRAYQYGISDKGYGDENAAVVSGRVLSAEERQQRIAFVSKIKKQGFQEAIEDVAYTWFNRFVVLRFMEVNNYLPSHIRVFSDSNGNFNPEILQGVLHLELEGLDKAKVFEMVNANQSEGLYRYLLITQCNALNAALPEMFEKLGSYIEMLLPNNILKPESVLGRLVTDIPEEDWKDGVQIIGWLYQYYNTEPKQAVFDGLKKNVKITKEKIPAATQLFTPDWIVRYMVENSLGRLWLESHPNEELKANWKYYLDEAEQTPEVAEKLRVLRSQSSVKSPEDIRLIDPCMGSGHILVYAFDVLMQIYESVGYNPRDAVKCILEKNIYGLDIDPRAYQLAYFSLMMKARQYNRRIFTDGVKPQVYHPAGFPDGEEYGSLVKVDNLEAMPEPPSADQIDLFDDYEKDLRIWHFKRLLSQTYDVVVTNPPYMGSSGMSSNLKNFVEKNYPDSKSDLFAVFIERCGELLNSMSYQAMITQHAWMFLSSYKELRAKLSSRDIINMAHLGARAFEEIGGEVVQATAFVLSKYDISNFEATYVRLVDYNSQQTKEEAFLSGSDRYTVNSDNFAKIPGSPVAYWVSNKLLQTFEDGKPLVSLADPKQGLATADNNRFLRLWHEVASSCIGFACASIEDSVSSGKKWFPYNKGGEFRKWYGNNDYTVNWKNDGNEVRNFGDCTGYIRSRAQNTQYYFKPAVTWSKISSGSIAFRFKPEGHIFDVAGTSIFANPDLALYLLGFNNSVVALTIASVLSPTLNYEVGHIASFPIIEQQTDEVKSIVSQNINLSRTDWDSFETSWDFKRHPLLVYGYQNDYGLVDSKYLHKTKPLLFDPEKHILEKEMGEPKHPNRCQLENCFRTYQEITEKRFQALKANEEELNRIFIDIYGLQDELTPEVEDKDVTVARIYDTKEDLPESIKGNRYVLTKEDVIKSFISYAVGCMFGRYSLDVEGLAYAGGDWDKDKYKSYIPDQDNILPISDDEYFEDDILGRFVDFVRTVYGKESLEDNLLFIADALGGKGTAREVIRNYFLNGFYKDHCKIYKKRPIYWLFDSGKKNGFKALVYLHRYQSDLIARLRTDYVHEQQERYRTQLAHISENLNTATGADRIQLIKQQNKFTDQLAEITKFEEKIHHFADMNIVLDLDDGVKKNYEIFEDVLAKI